MDSLTLLALAGMCSKEVSELAHKENWTSWTYHQEVAASYNQQSFRNRPETPGNWVEWTLYPKEMKKAPEVVTVNGHELKKYIFDQNCKVKSTAMEWPWYLQKVFNEKRNEDWTDEDWKATVASGKKGIIYFWSPRFTYSVSDLPRVEKLARKWGLDFTAVADPRASHSEITGALTTLAPKEQIKFRKLASDKAYYRNVASDFFMRTGYNHFPVVHVYANKKVHPRWITGIMTEGGLKSMITTFTGELK